MPDRNTKESRKEKLVLFLDGISDSDADSVFGIRSEWSVAFWGRNRADY